MARAKRNEEQLGMFEDGKDPSTALRRSPSPAIKGGLVGRPMTAPTSGTRDRISRSARNDSLWQVKKRGSVGVSSHAPNCGYDEGTVKSLQERGWHLYKDGEKVW